MLIDHLVIFVVGFIAQAAFSHFGTTSVWMCRLDKVASNYKPSYAIMA
jgi:hypothetical protein